MNSRLLDLKLENLLSGGQTIVARIEKALSFISSQNRDDWITCGMALKDEHDELVGLTYAAMYSDGDQYFETSATGISRENKALSAWMLTSLNFWLMWKVIE